MKHAKQTLANENGSIMVITLLLMFVLTVMGISAVDQSNIETMISDSERTYKRNFYKAEAAVAAAAQTMENATVAQLQDISDDAWIDTTDVDTTNPSLKDAGGVWLAKWSTIDGTSDYTNGRYTVVEDTGFLDLMAPSNLHEYKVFGVYDSTTSDRGRVLIEIGYKRRF